jgi:hypothetical protein
MSRLCDTPIADTEVIHSAIRELEALLSEEAKWPNSHKLTSSTYMPIVLILESTQICAYSRALCVYREKQSGDSWLLQSVN